MYQVLWHPDAFEELSALLADVDDDARAAILDGVRELGDRLRVDALNEGETRPDGRRIAFELPLVAIYRIDRRSASALILHAWLARRRGSTPE
jgi:hypothetical protein